MAEVIINENFDKSEITVERFINEYYKKYWQYSNKNGKNSIDPREQLPEVVRKIIYAAYKLGIKPDTETKTIELTGETVKYHAHGDQSLNDSIKGVATAYKSQPAARILRGIGSFGAAPGDDGAAARYTSIAGTPLLNAIYKDIPFVPISYDDTGLEQPEYISCPLPMALINGMSPIGTGKSCYLAERDARDIIDWIEALSDKDINFDREKAFSADLEPPEAMSVTGCETYFNSDNGYIYYDAVVHEGVDKYDINKKGKFDVITALPPKSNAANTIYKLQQKLPNRVAKNIIDGSGEGKPTWIVVPTGYLDPKDFAKYGMRLARKENIFIWDYNLDTMVHSDIYEIAKGWFEDRKKIVKKRLKTQEISLEYDNHKMNLAKIFAENDMIHWDVEKVKEYFIDLAIKDDYHGYNLDENHDLIILSCEEAGLEDAKDALNLTALKLLPESIKNNDEKERRNKEEIKKIKSNIKNIGDFIIKEARDIINEQEKFFVKYADE